MKQLLTAIFILVSFALHGQEVCREFRVTGDHPAPCDITSQRTEEYDVWNIRLGVFFNDQVNGHPDAFSVMIDGKKVFYHQEEFLSKESAQIFLERAILPKGIYCDAVVVLNPFRKKVYRNRVQSNMP